MRSDRDIGLFLNTPIRVVLREDRTLGCDTLFALNAYFGLLDLDGLHKMGHLRSAVYAKS
jgi:hypothetical protein